MTDQQTPTHRYDPLWDGPKKDKGSATRNFISGFVIIALHVGLIFYLYKTKIEPKYISYEDTAVKVELRKNAPPPPVQVHETPLPPVNVPAPPPLQIAPTPPQPPRPPEPPVVAAPAPPAQHVISGALLERQPSNDDLERYYPDRAKRLDKTGSASMRCSVTKTGLLTGCVVTGEDPPGYGFGDAALQMAKLFKLRPQSQDGTPVDGGTWSTRIRFQLGDN